MYVVCRLLSVVSVCTLLHSNGENHRSDSHVCACVWTLLAEDKKASFNVCVFTRFYSLRARRTSSHTPGMLWSALMRRREPWAA